MNDKQSSMVNVAKWLSIDRALRLGNWELWIFQSLLPIRHCIENSEVVVVCSSR